MKKIKAYISYNDYNKVHYYETFDIIEELPKIDNEKIYNDSVTNIEDIKLDCEQGNDDVYNYDYYLITYTNYEDFNNSNEKDKNIKDYQYNQYVAIEYNEN